MALMDWKSCTENVTSGAGGPPIEVPKLKCFEVVFANILTAAVGLAVLALLVMLIIGGIRYMTSGGDPKASTAAQQTITYAIGGIALMVIAYLIFFIIEKFTGVQITIFKIPEINP